MPRNGSPVSHDLKRLTLAKSCDFSCRVLLTQFWRACECRLSLLVAVLTAPPLSPLLSSHWKSAAARGGGQPPQAGGEAGSRQRPAASGVEGAAEGGITAVHLKGGAGCDEEETREV